MGLFEIGPKNIVEIVMLLVTTVRASVITLAVYLRWTLLLIHMEGTFSRGFESSLKVDITRRFSGQYGQSRTFAGLC